MQSQLLVQQRCPKCTLAPPCKHYEHPFEVTNDAERYILSKRFKNCVPPARRENLLNQIKHSQLVHNSNMSLEQTENSFSRSNRYGSHISKLPLIMNTESGPL